MVELRSRLRRHIYWRRRLPSRRTRRTVIMSFGNTEDTEERLSLVLRNPGTAAAMRDYFYDLWANARLLSY